MGGNSLSMVPGSMHPHGPALEMLNGNLRRTYIPLYACSLIGPGPKVLSTA
jgi:hypothetical protein